MTQTTTVMPEAGLGKQANRFANLIETEGSSNPLVAAATTSIVQKSVEGESVDGEALDFVDQLILEIEQKISQQLDEIVHSAEYQAVESAWIGAQRNLETGAEVALPGRGG